jgi:hypothetical protein
MVIAQSPIGALDPRAPPGATLPAPGPIGQRQSGSTHARDPRREKPRETSRVEVLQQRREASV